MDFFVFLCQVLCHKVIVIHDFKIPHCMIMRFMKTVRFLVFACMVSALYSCNDSDVFSPLYFEKEYYEKPLSANVQEIAFGGGSGNLSVEVSGQDIQEASVSDGKIKIKTKEKGIARLVVKDNADNASVTVRVKVVDKYMCLRLDTPAPGNSYYEYGDYLFLVNDGSRSFCLYDESFGLKDKGCYMFFAENSKPCLSLSSSEGVFNYDMTASSHAFLWGAIPFYLDFSWRDELVGARSQPVAPLVMNAVEFDTESVYCFVVDTVEMPYGVLE